MRRRWTSATRITIWAAEREVHAARPWRTPHRGLEVPDGRVSSVNPADPDGNRRGADAAARREREIFHGEDPRNPRDRTPQRLPGRQSTFVLLLRLPVQKGGVRRPAARPLPAGT